MAYALRYYKEIAQADGSVIRLEIHKKDCTAEAIEIGAVIQGLSLNIQGQQDEIDTPIQKTSLSMTFVDANDIDNGQKNGFWEEFYTPDALLWKVILKAKNASQTSFSTIWGGYVTPDSFSEDLVYRGGVNIIARDNIGHMQDFTFDALGDADGMISLRNLVDAGWEKIASPMELIWDGGDWLSCGDVVAFNTLMNVSMFEGMNWYKAIETALASYGAVMRYVGGNEVIITTLRHLPSFGANVDTLPHVEPVFVSGAQRELVPAVRKIEESVEYDLSGEVQPNISMQDFSGNVFDVETSWGTVEDRAWALLQTAPMYAFGWYNESTYKTLAFNPGAYTIDKLVSESDREAILKSTCILAGTKDDDTHSVSYNMTVGPEDYAINVLFGKFLSVLTNSAGDETLGYPISEVPAEYTVRYAISINDGDNVYYLTSGGIWSQSFASMTMLVSGDKMTINVPLSGEFTSRVLVSITFLNVDMGINALYPKQILGITLTNQSNKPSREKNTVNTIYNADNNVILSRSPEIGPAFDKVALPGFIKNGIFVRSEDDEILPARLWSWGGSEQQMAVWNHLQLLCYYAKPNNLISGTIVNADLSRVANIWVWHGAEHILVSGTYNFLNGRIESAVLREFARYDDMWSEVADASLPETEEDSTSNVESGSPAGGSSSTYTATQTVNIGTGGGVGASSLNDLLDVNVDSVSAQSVLYYNGTEWVSLSKAALLSGFVKEDDLEAILSAMNADIAKRALQTDLDTLALAVEDNTTNIKNAKGEIDTLKTDKADKATTLAGYGITDAYTKDDLATYKAWWDDMMSLVVKEGSNIKIKTNLIVEGDTASTKAGTDAGTSGTLIGVVVNGTSYDDETNGMLDLSTLMNQYALATAIPSLDGYAKLTDIPTIPSSLKNPYALTFGDKTYDGSSEQTITASDLGALTAHQAVTNTGNTLSFGSAVIIGSVGGTNLTAALPSVASVKTSLGLGSLAYKSSLVASDIPSLDWSKITSGKPTTLAGYGITDGITTSGGSIYGDLYFDYSLSKYSRIYFIDRRIYSAGYADEFIVFRDGSGVDKGAIGLYGNANGVSYYYFGHNAYNGDNLRVYADSLTFGGNKILHASNYTSYTYSQSTIDSKLAGYLPLSGGTMKGSLNFNAGLSINSANTIVLEMYSGADTYLRGSSHIYLSTPSLNYQDANGYVHPLIHSGNIGSQSVNYATSAGSATKLATARTIWGQSFDGTGNVADPAIMSYLRFKNIDGTSTSYIGRTASADNDIRLYIATDYGFRIYTNGVERFILNSSGNVTIGSGDLAGTSAKLYVAGNAIITGDTATGSDIRFKDKLSDHRIALSDIAEAPLFTFKWNDRDDDSVHLGSSAQYWEKVAPWLVKGEDFKTLDYSTLGVAIGISLANKAMNLEDRIKILEKENKALKEELRRIQYGS